MSRYCGSVVQNHDYEIVRSNSYSLCMSSCVLIDDASNDQRTLGASNNFRLTSYAPKGIGFVILSNRH